MPGNAEKARDLTVVNPNNEVLRDDQGRFLKGTRTVNPSGRKKLTGIQKYLRQAAGEVTEDLFNILIEISSTESKKVRTNDKIKAVELLLAYAHGRPTQHVEAQVETKSINVEVKLPDDIEVIDI